MRKRRWIKNALNGIAWVTIVFLGCNILLRTLSLPTGSRLKEGIEKTLNRVEHAVGTMFLHTYSPTAQYLIEEDTQDTLVDWILNVTAYTIPTGQYLKTQNAVIKNREDPAYQEYLEDTKNAQAMQEIVEGMEEENKIVKENKEEIQTTEETVQVADTAQTEGEIQNTEITQPSEDGQTTDSLEASNNSPDIFHPQVIGTEYSIAKLSDYDFLIRNFYSVSEITTITSGELNAENLLGMDMAMKTTNDKPQILIYHTHSQEEFVDSVPGNEADLITGVGDYLAQILTEQFGYQVIHDTTPYDIKNGIMDKNKAYTYAEEGISAILEANPSIELVIDMHRDGVNEGVHLVTEVNGKPTAQIMFVNGISKTTLQGSIDYLYNPYIEENLALSLQLQLKSKAYYPDFARRIMIKAYRYNLHYRPKSLLIEVGAQTSTVQEAKNAMEPLAVIIHEVLK